jgi:hypothetical protein
MAWVTSQSVWVLVVGFLAIALALGFGARAVALALIPPDERAQAHAIAAALICAGSPPMAECSIGGVRFAGSSEDIKLNETVVGMSSIAGGGVLGSRQRSADTSWVWPRDWHNSSSGTDQGPMRNFEHLVWLHTTLVLRLRPARRTVFVC